MITIMGTLKEDIMLKFLAIASLMPLSSLSIPGYAPGVSMKVMIGKEKSSANFINLEAFL